MFSLIRRLIFFAILAAVVFVVLSLMSGGEKFRWFGQKVGQESERVGKEADRLKEKSERVMEGIESTKEKVKGVIGGKDDKSR